MLLSFNVSVFVAAYHPVLKQVYSSQYSPSEARLDPDRLGGLVWAGGGPCLVFCATKRNCENVAALLCRMHAG